MINPRSLYPVVVFVGLLVLAIIVGNAFLTFVMQRPIDQVPNFLKFIVHGISLTFIALLAKKYFGG
jgi:hypothetical protein